MDLLEIIYPQNIMHNFALPWILQICPFILLILCTKRWILCITPKSPLLFTTSYPPFHCFYAHPVFLTATDLFNFLPNEKGLPLTPHSLLPMYLFTYLPSIPQTGLLFPLFCYNNMYNYKKVVNLYEEIVDTADSCLRTFLYRLR